MERKVVRMPLRGANERNRPQPAACQQVKDVNESDDDETKFIPQADWTIEKRLIAAGIRKTEKAKVDEAASKSRGVIENYEDYFEDFVGVPEKDWEKLWGAKKYLKWETDRLAMWILCSEFYLLQVLLNQSTIKGRWENALPDLYGSRANSGLPEILRELGGLYLGGCTTVRKEMDEMRALTRGTKKIDARPPPQPPSTKKVANPPKFALEGKKWVIANHESQDLLIKPLEASQVVYIFNCKESVIKIQGKVNSIILDSCQKTTVVFDSVVSTVQFVNCRDCEMRVLVSVPTVTYKF